MPDDKTLLLWLEDELCATDSAAVEAWVAAHKPSHLQKRDELRQWKSQLPQLLPLEQEPPYPDFFQSRLLRAIQENQPATPAQAQRAASPASTWKKWLMPSMAAAACVCAFSIGMNWDRSHPAETLVTYTPEEGVRAEYFEKSPAEATVIVLQGVAALPENLIENDTASHDVEAEGNQQHTSSIVAP